MRNFGAFHLSVVSDMTELFYGEDGFLKVFAVLSQLENRAGYVRSCRVSLICGFRKGVDSFWDKEICG